MAYRDRRARLKGCPCTCGNSTTVSTQRWWIMRNVFRSFSSAWPITIVCESMSASNDLRIDVRG